MIYLPTYPSTCRYTYTHLLDGDVLCYNMYSEKEQCKKMEQHNLVYGTL